MDLLHLLNSIGSLSFIDLDFSLLAPKDLHYFILVGNSVNHRFCT